MKFNRQDLIIISCGLSAYKEKHPNTKNVKNVEEKVKALIIELLDERI